MLLFLDRQEERSIDESKFQLERSWRSFRTRFRSEEHCIDAVYRELKNHLICQECGGRTFHRDSGDRRAFCASCGMKIWITSGTFFHRKKLLRAWLAAIWLMESGAGVSACFLHQKLKIAYSTAHEILRALSDVIEAQREDSIRHLHSNLFLDLFCRRSRETPARVHPREEQSEAEAEAERMTGDIIIGAINSDASNSALSSPAPVFANYQIAPTGEPELDAAERAVFGALSQGPLSFDKLAERLSLPAGTLMAAITMLELKGNARRVGIQLYEACMPESVGDSAQNGSGEQLWEGAMEFVEDIKVFIRSTYMGISRKYLQSYLASHWCYRDRKRWGRYSLLRACLLRGAGVGRADTAVTPLLVKVTV